MSDIVSSVRDDIAFMRRMAEDGRKGPILGGSIMAAAGGVYGIASLIAWLMATGAIPAPVIWQIRIWWLAMAVNLLIWIPLVLRFRIRRPRTGGRRVNQGFAAIWNGVGAAIFTCAFSLVLAQHRLHDPAILAGFPSLVLALYGAGWLASAVLSQTRWMGAAALGSFAAALAGGALAGTSTLLLLFAAALVLLMALPGVALMRGARMAAVGGS
jgi:hypothetical protein